jgi:hypothetical protein
MPRTCGWRRNSVCHAAGMPAHHHPAAGFRPSPLPPTRLSWGDIVGTKIEAALPFQRPPSGSSERSCHVPYGVSYRHPARPAGTGASARDLNNVREGDRHEMAVQSVGCFMSRLSAQRPLYLYSDHPPTTLAPLVMTMATSRPTCLHYDHRLPDPVPSSEEEVLDNLLD